MTDRELELRLKKAVETCTPDVLDKVMAQCDTYQDVIPFKKRKSQFRQWAALAAAFAVVAGAGLFGYFGIITNRVASIVSLEVNPSIELRINKKEEVIEANAMNEDAEQILEGMKLKGTDVHTATNAIIGSLLKHGYIDELANSILLSVEDADSARGAALQEVLSDEINAILSATSVNAAILSQQVDDSNVEKLADELDVSKGKAALVKNIVEGNNAYKAKDLAELSVNELNLIVSNPKNEVKDVVSTGTASENAYIGKEKAKEAAFVHAGVDVTNVCGLEVDFDYEYGKMVYELEFESAEYDYDYSIDAKTGDVLYSYKELDDDYVAPKQMEVKKPVETRKENRSTVTDIGKDKAKSIALANAGLSESQVTRLHVERDIDDGRIEYNVEFKANGKEYDYEINGADGKILDYDVEVENRN